MNFNPGGPTPTTTASAFAFNANKPAPTFSFGGDAPKPGNLFGSPAPTASAAPIFGSPASSAPIFGAASSPSTSAPIFGAASPPTSAFSFGAPTQPAAFKPPGVTPAAPPQFSFGQQKPAQNVFGFGASAAPVNPTQTPQVPTFGTPKPPTVTTAASAAPAWSSFSNISTAPAISGTAPAPVATFGFGNPTQPPATSVPTFGFTSPPNSNAAPTSAPNFSGFNFGQNQPKPAAATTPTSVAKPAVNFGAAFQPPSSNMAPVSAANPPAQPATSVSPFGFGAAPRTAAPLSFGVSTPASISFGKPAPTTTSAPATGFGLQTAVTPPQSGFNFGQAQTPASVPVAVAPAPTSLATSITAPITTTKSSLPSFGVSTGFSTGNTLSAPVSNPVTTTATGGFQLPNSTQLAFSVPSVLGKTDALGGSSTAAPAITQSSAVTAVASSAVPSSGFQLTLPVTTTATSLGQLPSSTTASNTLSQPAPAMSMTFGQLEDAINKWNLELEEQEKVFINQATQVNAWDRLLIANGEKIVSLNEALQCVKTEQQGLDHELDFILGQQRELEELLVPLEKELGNVVITDPEREHTYRLADSIDTQIKQLSEDLKELIEHLNESNRIEDNNDPIVQIGRILNAHMSSMQWIDSSTAQISHKLEQLSSMLNTFKHQNKISFQRTFW